MLTNFPNGISSFGVLTMGMGGIPITGGKYYFVNSDTGSDGNTGLEMASPMKTVAAAYAKMTTDKYDVMICMGAAVHTISEMLVIEKNRCIFIGLDGSGGRSYGSRTQWKMGVLAVSANVTMVKNTGVGNVFLNIKFFNNDSTTENIWGFAEGGEYTYFANCEFYKPTHYNSATASELLMNGDSSAFYNCTFGDLVNLTVGAVVRPCVILTRNLITGKACRDGLFVHCEFLRRSGNAACRLIYSTLANDVERRLTFKDCIFVGAKLSSTIPGEAIDGANALTDGQILLHNCSIFNISKISTLTGVFGTMPTADASMDTVAIQAT